MFDQAKAMSIFGPPGAGRAAKIDRLEQLLNQQQGTAARKFLRLLVRDDEAKRKLRKYAEEFMEEVKGSLSSPVAARMAGRFAVAAAAARLAIGYHVLPWRVSDTIQDIETCLFDALALMNTDGPDDAAPTDDELLSRFRSEIAELNLLDLDTRKKSSVSAEEIRQYAAFRRTLRRGTAHAAREEFLDEGTLPERYSWSLMRALYRPGNYG